MEARYWITFDGQINGQRAREMAQGLNQGLRALAVLLQGLGSIPSTCMLADQPTVTPAPGDPTHAVHRHRCRKNNQKKKSKKPKQMERDSLSDQ